MPDPQTISDGGSANDTSAKAIFGHLGHEPATLVEFEAVYGVVKRPDDDGWAVLPGGSRQP